MKPTNEVGENGWKKKRIRLNCSKKIEEMRTGAAAVASVAVVTASGSLKMQINNKSFKS